MELEGQALALSPRETDALSALGVAVRGGIRGRQDAALATARNAVGSRDGRHVLALYQLELGGLRNDNSLRAPALDELIASELTRPAKLAGYLAARGSIAFQLRDFETASRHWTRLLEMSPNDPDVLANLAQVRQAQNDPQGAADLLARAIAARTAAGGPISEIWYRQRMSLANQAALLRPAIAAGRALVGAYPSPRNWREALVVYRQLAAPRDGLEIDLLRLMRFIGALSRGAEYQRMAQLLNRAAAAVEAKAVLDEGVARGLLIARESPTREIIAEVDRTIPRDRVRVEAMQRQRPAANMLALANALAGSGRHAEAIPLYRAALDGADADAAEVNVRLGMVLLLAGQRPQAEAAFRLAAEDEAALAQPGRYADLAQFWLAWLAQAPAASPASVTP